MQVCVGNINSIVNLNGVSYRINILENSPRPDVLGAAFTTTSIPARGTAILIIDTTILVESIKIVNKAGRDQSFDIISIETIDGIKKWTVEYRITSAGTQNYTVTGYDADGITGATATASISVTRY